MSAIFKETSQPVSSSAGELSGRWGHALVALPVLAAIFSVGISAVLLVLAVSVAIGLSEHTDLMHRTIYGRRASRRRRTTAMVLGIALLAVVAFAPTLRLATLGTAALLILSALLVGLGTRSHHIAKPPSVASAGMSLLLVALPLGLLARLYVEAGSYGASWLVMSLVVMGMGDTGAFFIGRRYGRHPLSVQAAPEKTWEGALGGLVAVLGVTVLIEATGLLPLMTLSALLGVAVVAYVLGIAGDLSLSALKRSAGVRRSGSLMGPHGGLLDRIDGLLFAAPWLYLAFSLV